jgi:hypothetical protein
MKARFCVLPGPTDYLCTMPRTWNWRSEKAYFLPRLMAIFKKQRPAKGSLFRRLQMYGTPRAE